MAINEQSVGHLYRLYISLVSGAWPQRQERIETAAKKHGGIILKVDGLEPDQDGPGLYVMWEALSGTPISGVLLDTADTEHLTDWLEKCRELLGEVPVRGTMCDKEAAVYGALQIVWPEAKHGLCQLHFLNNLAEPIIEADKELKKGIGDKIGRLPGIPKLSEAEAERRNKALLDNREGNELESATAEERFEPESEVLSSSELGDDSCSLISEANPDRDPQADVPWSAAGSRQTPDGWVGPVEEKNSDCLGSTEPTSISAWSLGTSGEQGADQNQTTALPAATTLTAPEPKLAELDWIVASPSTLGGCVEPPQPLPEPTIGSEAGPETV
ncbi:MAG: transposase, partial [Gammaproteobacteria bacterium]|nr:transposase [Gammaproteobacteria bacterium]